LFPSVLYVISVAKKLFRLVRVRERSFQVKDVDTENILGYGITTKSVDACTEEILGWVRNNEQGRYLVCANPHSLEAAREDPLFQEALKKADMVLPDGIGIIIASKLLGGTIRERVTGSDIFRELNKGLARRGGCSVFFLGSTEETLGKIRSKMAIDCPGLRVAGTYSPPFRAVFSESENAAMAAAVNAARPDVLWVGMTAPKQEKWIYQHRARLNVKVIGAIGAVFDFYTGRVKRSNPVFLRMGLEWLPRLLQEPRRLWRRNFVSNPAFLLRVIQVKYSKSAAKEKTLNR